MRKVLVAAACGFSLWAAAAGAADRGKVARPVVAELFTSEGCSSCPPADALLSELAQTRPDVLPLAFHVTYWDRLGWPDPFALGAATSRQRNYAEVLGLDAIYTPQLVVDGIRDVVGSDRPSVLQAIHAAQAAAPPPVSLRLVRAASGITVELGSSQEPAKATLLLAGFDSAHRTVVARGENAGRTLVEANIVRGLVRAGAWDGASESLHAEAPAGEHVAAILQAADGRILAASVLD